MVLGKHAFEIPLLRTGKLDKCEEMRLVWRRQKVCLRQGLNQRSEIQEGIFLPICVRNVIRF